MNVRNKSKVSIIPNVFESWEYFWVWDKLPTLSKSYLQVVNLLLRLQNFCPWNIFGHKSINPDCRGSVFFQNFWKLFLVIQVLDLVIFHRKHPVVTFTIFSVWVWHFSFLTSQVFWKVLFVCLEQNVQKWSWVKVRFEIGQKCSKTMTHFNFCKS